VANSGQGGKGERCGWANERGVNIGTYYSRTTTEQHPAYPQAVVWGGGEMNHM